MIKRLRKIDLLDVRVIGLVLMLIAFGSATYGYIEVHGDFDLLTVLSDFYANISAELGSIAITVLIIDGLSRRRDEKEREEAVKEQLIRETGSQVNDVAINAIEQLRAKGWLTGEDGILQKSNLSGANLQNVNLYEANLQGANLQSTDLQGAHLVKASIQHADLLNANLQGANLMLANLQNMKLYVVNLMDEAKGTRMM